MRGNEGVESAPRAMGEVVIAGATMLCHVSQIDRGVTYSTDCLSQGWSWIVEHSKRFGRRSSRLLELRLR